MVAAQCAQQAKADGIDTMTTDHQLPNESSKGLLLRVLGVVCVLVGALDCMLAWRGGFSISLMYLVFIAAGILLFVLGAIRRAAKPHQMNEG